MLMKTMRTDREEQMLLFPHFYVTQTHAYHISKSTTESSAGLVIMCQTQTADVAKPCVCQAKNKHFSSSISAALPKQRHVLP